MGFIVRAVLLLLMGCSSTQPTGWSEKNGKVKILSTTKMIDDVVGQIGGDRIEHTTLIVGEIDPHSYELVKGDDEKISSAQLVFYNGLGLEHGASLSYQLHHHKNAIGLGNTILEKNPESILHIDDELDPHLWMDISVWKEIIPLIVDALVAIDPQGKSIYEKNAQAVSEEMELAHKKIYESIQHVPQEKRYLVTSHDAFNYFARAYLREESQENWRERFDAPEGLSPEGQLSTADIQQVIDHLIFYHIGIVFPESNISRDSLKKIVHACKRKGLDVKISADVLYGDSMGSATYLEMMQHNADVMIKGWGAEK